eukprot:CAMPEP_0172408992 /NCGR_PEP_ID=MMETSP1061-20121228/76138_1 /TAXON_ID=37318 /ORGANISM="Pseudo-nitzschia pungens, Strain cf. pungens" /LENGTH=375 /DNA_ID=CAMNT_0013145137 /DNA_START=666 /DNA_END=1796 /DNA_ORIENTATION=-
MAKAVSPMVQQSYKLLRKTRLSEDSCLLRYGLPEGRTILGTDPTLPTCIKVDYFGGSNASDNDIDNNDNDNKPLLLSSKSYSPVTHPNQSGHFDLVVKSYPYREGGGVGAYLCDMAEGDSISATLKKERVMHGSSAVLGRGWKKVGLVAGGTGIAPLLQIARILLENDDNDKNSNDKNKNDDKDKDSRPRIHLLFVNHTPSDILGVEAIEALAREHPDHFFVTYSFTRQETKTKTETKTEAEADHCLEPAGAAVFGPESASRFTTGRGDVAMARAALPSPSSVCSSSSSESESQSQSEESAPPSLPPSLPPPSLSPPQSDTMIFVCGRDGFVAHWAGPVTRAPPKPNGKKGPKIQGPLLGVLAEAGFTAEQVFKY